MELKRVSFVLDDEVIEFLDRCSKEMGLSRSEVARLLLRALIKGFYP